MKLKSYSLLPILCGIIFMFIATNLSAQDYFPLEVGNRWDYNVEIHSPGGHISYDTLSILITENKILSNGMEYYVFSPSLPMWFPVSIHAREEDNKIYVYLEEDSTDCFSFRFDIAAGSFYFNCNNYQVNVFSIDTVLFWGTSDIHQLQDIFYAFSEHFGIYDYYEPGLVPKYYYLSGCIISGITYGNLLVSVDETGPVLPTKFSLSQNYPNPFNPSTKIKYAVSSRQFVTLKVYDVLGNEIATLVNEEKPAGSYEVEFIAKDFPSGVYFYQLKAGTFMQTKKMILLR